jgi:hypothetical protein
MYFVLAHKDNNAITKRFLLPKVDEESENWVEIIIDEKAGEFIAKKIRGKFKENPDWQRYHDTAFATSLFSRFLKDEQLR